MGYFQASHKDGEGILNQKDDAELTGGLFNNLLVIELIGYMFQGKKVRPFLQ